MPEFRVHHTAISVRDLQRSTEFYEYFGFHKAFTWEATDGSLTLVHLTNAHGEVLEIICYANPESIQPPAVGNDLSQIGVKHLALQVDDLQSVYEEIVESGLGEVTEITHGRTLIDLFFVRDPDGIWVEVLTDNRALDNSNPVVIKEAPRLLQGE
jgi:glyoxylase I family protein